MIQIDWELLRRQKEWLMNYTDDSHEEIDGLIQLLDSLQDLAIESGEFSEETVFGTRLDQFEPNLS